MSTDIATIKINELNAAITQGLAAWKKAGDLVVEILDSGKTRQELVTALNSELVTEDVICQFERIGRKQLLPELLVADYPAARHIMGLPFSDQHNLKTIPIDVVVVSGGKGGDVLKVQAASLSKDQCRQVFNQTETGKQIRNPAQQRAWIESEKAKRQRKEGAKVADVGWQVKGKELHINGVILTKSQLHSILALMEK